MFARSEFNQSIESWDVSNVKSMTGMFYGSDFNQPLEHWDVCQVKTMELMFAHSAFRQNISGWPLTEDVCLERMFWSSAYAKALGQEDVTWEAYVALELEKRFNETWSTSDVRPVVKQRL